MKITRIGSQPSGKGGTQNFTGHVRRDPLFTAEDPSRLNASCVTFEPAARTVWHTHPLGQLIIITAGCGWVQCDGQAIEAVYPGDIVWFQPGEKHWHGATSANGMTHIAIAEQLNGSAVTWLEPVTDEQYSAKT